MKNGIIAGIILVVGLANEMVGLPLLFLYLLLTSKKLSLDRKYLPIVLLLQLKVLWITLVSIAYKDASILSYFRTIGVDMMIMLTILLKKDKNFYKGLFIPIAALFVVDLVFNIWTYSFGADLLGRLAMYRPGDIIPRTGGVFYHPYYSINISIVVILFSIFLRRRLLLVLSILNIVSNGSYRGSLTLIILAAVTFLLIRRAKFRTLVAISLVMVASVLALTVVSVSYIGSYSGNYYRVFAWVNAIENIGIHPIVGTHTFILGKLPSVSEYTIMEFGIAESPYLNYALHYGILPALVHLVVITFVFSQRVKSLYLQKKNRLHGFHIAAAIFAGVAFVDTFYGTVLGSMLTTMSNGLMCISSRDVDKTGETIQNE
jgi:hypothetical protein